MKESPERSIRQLRKRNLLLEQTLTVMKDLIKVADKNDPEDMRETIRLLELRIEKVKI